MHKSYLDLCNERCPDDVHTVRALGYSIGYGHLMELASAIWREGLSCAGLEGGELAVGPCVSVLVPCQCTARPEMYQEDICDWCCGTGRVTKRVAQAQQEADQCPGA